MNLQGSTFYSLKGGSFTEPETLDFYDNRIKYTKRNTLINEKQIISIPTLHINEVEIIKGLLYFSIKIKSFSNCQILFSGISRNAAQKLKRIIGK